MISLQSLFWICAIVGSTVFALKLLMLFIGGADFDMDPDADFDTGDAIDGHHTEVAFKVISLTSISAFLMMFGWVGLACSEQYQLGSIVSLLVAVLIGTITMFFTAYLFKLAMKLVSSGASFNQNDIVGLKATVYQRIPAKGTGRVQVVVGGVMREMDAITENGKELESFKNVEILKLGDGSVVTVKEIKV